MAFVVWTFEQNDRRNSRVNTPYSVDDWMTRKRTPTLFLSMGWQKKAESKTKLEAVEPAIERTQNGRKLQHKYPCISAN